MQKSSNTVALVESFLGEFKPDYEGIPEPVASDNSNIKVTVENNEERVDNLDPSEEPSINDSQDSVKLESEVFEKIIDNKPDITHVLEPVNKPDNANDAKETIEEYIAPVIEQLPPTPPPPPPPPPVKRKVCFINC